MKKTMKIEGMMCAHCEAAVKKALEAIPEVVDAEVSHTAGTAVVTLQSPWTTPRSRRRWMTETTRSSASNSKEKARARIRSAPSFSLFLYAAIGITGGSVMIVAPAGGAVSGFSLVVRTLTAASKVTSQTLRTCTAPLTVMRLLFPVSV